MHHERVSRSLFLSTFSRLKFILFFSFPSSLWIFILTYPGDIFFFLKLQYIWIFQISCYLIEIIINIWSTFFLILNKIRIFSTNTITILNFYYTDDTLLEQYFMRNQKKTEKWGRNINRLLHLWKEVKENRRERKEKRTEEM